MRNAQRKGNYHDTSILCRINESSKRRCGNGEEPVVNSRYSIVIAAAKRARQIIAGDEPMAEKKVCPKPLSIAVEELYEGKVKILPETSDEE